MDFPTHASYPGEDISGDETMDDKRPRRRNDKPGGAQQEILQRSRRIETRLTSLIVAMGYDTEAQRPTYENGRVQLPSPHTSIQQVIDSIPENSVGSVRVYIGDRLVATIDRSGN